MRLKPLAPGKNIRLTDASARAPKDAPPKPEAVKAVERLGARIDELQDVLYAEGRRALLVVLQGRDTSGKDGTIRKVFGPLDPLGIMVASFKAPTEQELFAMRRAAWRKQGIVVIRPADVRDEWTRQALVNEATRLYGRREVA